VNSTTVTIIPTVIVKVTNYENTYSGINANEVFSISPAFLYTECPDITTPQPMQSGIDINCVLYD
jgi:hypothetical protein